MPKYTRAEKLRRKKRYAYIKARRAKWTESFLRRTPLVSISTYMMREDILRSEGFLPFETFWLAQHTIASPAMKTLRIERQNFFEASHIVIDNKLTFDWNRYQREIARAYQDNHWLFRDGSSNPFAMLEDIKRRGHYPDTPQPKRTRPWVSPTKGQRETAKRKRAELLAEHELLREHEKYIMEHRLR